MINLFICIFCFWCTAEAQPVLEPPISISAVAEGDPFKVVCIGSPNLVWKLGPKVVTTNKELAFAKVALTDAGHYECLDGANTVKFQLLVFQVETENATFSFREAAKLVCRVKDARARPFTYSWQRGNETGKQVLDSVDEKHYHKKANITQHPNGTLEFINPRRELVGLWSCVVETVEAGATVTMVKNIPYYAEAYIKPLSDPTNTEEFEQPRTEVPMGGNLTLRCTGLGYPPPNLSWLKGQSKRIKSDSRYKVSQDGPSLTLSMTGLTWDDAGEYNCTGSSVHFPGVYSNKTVHIRISDSRTLLWAYLAIGGQLLCILTIIILSEEKRKRAEMAEKKIS